MIGKDNNEKLQQKMAETMHIEEKDNKCPEKKGNKSVYRASRALSDTISDRHALSRELRGKILS